jgi:hypothetical protein
MVNLKNNDIQNEHDSFNTNKDEIHHASSILPIKNKLLRVKTSKVIIALAVLTTTKFIFHHKKYPEAPLGKFRYLIFKCLIITQNAFMRSKCLYC